MGFAALSLILAVASTATAQPTGVLQTKQENALDSLVKDTLEYARWLLQRHEPISFPPIPAQQIVLEEVNLQFSTHDLRASKLKDFIIDDISNFIPTLNATFGLTFPHVFLEGNYVVTGTAFKKDVKGAGTFSVAIDSFTPRGNINYYIVEHFLQVQHLELDYQLSGAKFHIEGVKIDGLTEGDIENFLNKNLPKYLVENKPLICQVVADKVTFAMNQILYGHSPENILKWLKGLVAATPDPPNFPTREAYH